mmetsp:Transcript_67269/g.217127  ORF Transcript_67269/g.217127 Transcript_67269/m.217127 type:complete len:206 (+) Transcript_67269:589-1206(+)
MDPGWQSPERLKRGRRGEGIALHLARRHVLREGRAVAAEQDGGEDRDGGPQAVAHDGYALPRRVPGDLHELVLHDLHHELRLLQDTRVHLAAQEGLLGADHLLQRVRRGGGAPDAEDDVVRLGVVRDEEAGVAQEGGVVPQVLDVLCVQGADVLGHRPLAVAVGRRGENRIARGLPEDAQVRELGAGGDGLRVPALLLHLFDDHA